MTMRVFQDPDASLCHHREGESVHPQISYVALCVRQLRVLLRRLLLYMFIPHNTFPTTILSSPVILEVGSHDWVLVGLTKETPANHAFIPRAGV